MFWRLGSLNSETYFVNILHNRGNAINNARNYLKYNNGNGYLKLSRLLKQNTTLNDALNYNSCFSKKFDSIICDSLMLKQLPIQKLALFLTTLIINESSKINEFLGIKREFEQCILTKEYKVAEKLLLKVFYSYGLSLWLLDSCSILETLSHNRLFFLEQLGEFECANYNILNIKNNLGEQHTYYVKRFTETFDSEKFKKPLSDYLKYLLFIQVPNLEEEWKNILLSACHFSLIDIYLSLVDYLQKFANSKSSNHLKKCCAYIGGLDDNKNKIICEIREDNSTLEFSTNETSNLIEFFEKGKYQDVVNLFFSNDFNEYDSFSAYRLTAISLLMLGKEPENSENLLFNIILTLIYSVLKRDISKAIEAIDQLARIARLLKSFSIHKGICIFLDLVANYKLGYLFHEQFSTFLDVQIFLFEQNTNNFAILPYKCKYTDLKPSIVKEYIQAYDNNKITINIANCYYFEEAYIDLRSSELISIGNITEATTLIIKSYIKNKLLIYVIDVTEIISDIRKKVTQQIGLTFEQVCYVFIDDRFRDIQRDCFLDLFDNLNIKEPLELTKNISSCNLIIDFFLDKICDVTMLTNLYWLFSSGDEVNNYRIKICEFLLAKKDYPFRKRLIDEIEEITKNRALSGKLKAVEKSRLTIKTDSFKNNCREKIEAEINIYNNTREDSVEFESFTNGLFIVKYLNAHYGIIKNIYDIYNKEFCFGDYGLDISLSTRVRHGTLSNQILKVFSDNHLNCNGHGSNNYFDNLIKSKEINNELRHELIKFTTKIQQELNYFTQHILKVYIDKPIEGALFNYEFSENEFEDIFNHFINIKTITFDDVILVINDFLINKTNNYLEQIRTTKLNALQEKLLSELTSFSNSIKQYIYDRKTEDEIHRHIINCKTSIQHEISLISQWFTLSEYNNWEDYTFEDLIETSKEIDKNLFSDFDKIRFNCTNSLNVKFNGDTFRYFIDIILIIFNNAINHSGYKDTLTNLEINYSFSSDSKHLYLAFENNLDEDINFQELDSTINKINNDYVNKKYLRVNTRQEGGMGLYKIMHIIFTVLKYGESFYVSRSDKNFRVEIQLKKELLCNE